MTGITMGEMINKLIGALSRILDFTSATAAGTPMISEKAVHIVPTMKLCQRARIHFSELKTSSYHRKESPSSGYVKNCPVLKDRGMIARRGTTKNRRTRAP